MGPIAKELQLMPAQDQLGVWKSETGFAFRVWAPNASDVSVVGEFNGWDWSKNTVAKDGLQWRPLPTGHLFRVARRGCERESQCTGISFA